MSDVLVEKKTPGVREGVTGAAAGLGGVCVSMHIVLNEKGLGLMEEQAETGRNHLAQYESFPSSKANKATLD